MKNTVISQNTVGNIYVSQGRAVIEKSQLLNAGYGLNVTGTAQASVHDTTFSGHSGIAIHASSSAEINVDHGLLFVKGVVLRSNGNAGVYVRSGSAATASATVVKSRSVGNAVGFMVGSNGKMSLYDSVASENSDAGLLASLGNAPSGLSAADPPIAEINVEEMVLTENAVGARAEAASGKAIIRLSKALVTGNTAAPTALGGLGRIVSFGNNRIAGGRDFFHDRSAASGRHLQPGHPHRCSHASGNVSHHRDGDRWGQLRRIRAVSARRDERGYGRR